MEFEKEEIKTILKEWRKHIKNNMITALIN